MKALLGLLLLAAPVYADGYEALISGTTPKVVTIKVTGVMEVPVYLSVETATKTVTVGGSGAFITPDGFVLTCNHLFNEPMKDMRVVVKTSKGKELVAFIVGQDDKQDLALLKVFPMTPVPYFKLGRSVRQGQRVLSLGSPLGIENVATLGYVSKVNALGRKETIPHTMHTASINPGNSGGPLVNTKGELVGVNVATYMSSMFSAAEGMHLAVRLQTIKKFLGGK